MKRILVTGGSGHLGGRALELLVPGNEIHAIVHTVPKAPYPGVHYHVIDLSDDWSSQKLPSQIDAVIHLAQSKFYRDFPKQSPETFRVNVASTATLLDYAWRAGAGCFVLASTGGLYSPSAAVIGEHTPVNPPEGSLGYYFRSKLAAELLVQAYKAVMSVSILRPFFIYGPKQGADKLVARLLASVQQGLPIQLSGDGGLVINPVFVDDVVDLLRIIVDKPDSQTLTVSGPDSVSIRDIAEAIGREVGCSPVFEQKEGGGEMLIADHRPLEALLGRPLIGFSEGLRRTLR